jgi:lysozyme family protein
MSGFLQALPFVLEMEGGYANHPSDPGGATNFGITQLTYNQWRVAKGLKWANVRHITEEEVQAIYHERYWTDGHCDSLPWPVSLAHFDACVNHGIGNATKLLQKALGVTPDGVIGPVTEAAIHRADPDRLLNDMGWTRLRFYFDICQRRPASKVFLMGWVLRLLKLRKRVAA